MELTDQIKGFLREQANALRGFDRRLFMARTVRLLGPDGQRRAERELGWNRVTVRKGMHELDSGIRCLDAFSSRGRKRAEEHLPSLLDDIRSIVDAQTQTDPTFDTRRLYTRISAAEVRRQLALQKGHAEARLPSEETIRRKMHATGTRSARSRSVGPKKVAPDGRHLRPTEPGEWRGRCLGGHAAVVTGRESEREDRLILAWRAILG